ncbi:MAG: LamG domain-containing protein [Nitrospinota bacterium]|nr:LamG domain-containing protein [Nitrospinota bacterium]
MDPTRRIIDFKMGGSIILLHFDEDTGAADIQDGTLPFGWIRHTDGFFIDSSPNNQQIGRTAWTDPPYYHENPSIVAGGKFNSRVRSSLAQYIYWPHHDAMNLDGDDFTASVWFNSEELGDAYWHDKGGLFQVRFRFPPHVDIFFGLADPSFEIPGTPPYTYPPEWFPHVYCGVELEGGAYYGAAEGTTVVSPGSWHHLALVRQGAWLYLYLNGALEASYEVGPGFWLNATVKPTPTALWSDFHTIYSATSYDDYIYFDEFNIQKGVLFDGPFTPPTEPYTL